MALDRVGTGDHLITGSRDTTCVVWRFGSNVSLLPYRYVGDSCDLVSLPLSHISCSVPQEVYDHPLQTLYGHDSEVCTGVLFVGLTLFVCLFVYR